MIPALGASTDPGESGTRPRSEEAYDLYLRSMSMPHDPGPNKEAIAMLERAVGIDPTYAPAWDVLGQRYYYDSTYSTGGPEMFQRLNLALEKALALDPNLAVAAAHLVGNRTEEGKLVQAYQDAAKLVKRRPENAQAHFNLGYVLRYAGLLEESEHECEAAVAVDPGNYQLRSCALAYMQSGNSDRAKEFIRLDTGSEWANFTTYIMLLRENKIEEARLAIRQAPTNPYYHRDVLEACLQPAQPQGLDRIAHEMEASLLAKQNPEPLYFQGAAMAFCGKQDIALRLLRTAIERNYCSYSALQSDPLLAKLRSAPEFSQLLSAAKSCRDSFLAKRNLN